MTLRGRQERDGWTRVRFGDVVENVNDQPKRSTLPLDTRYIAGEHVDENRLTIDRWGTLGDELIPPTFKRRFQPGDVLFHSRNLKKIAVPDFGGITGEKLFVLRSTSSALLQEFVPYVLLSPAFAAYAEASWSGSVNKFLNWLPLAKYECDLPPIREQRKLSRMFSSASAMLDALQQARRRGLQALTAFTDDAFSGDAVSTRFGELAEIQVGFPFPSSNYTSNGIRLLRGSNVGVNCIDWTPEITRHWPSDRIGEVAEYQLHSGDIVIALDRPFISQGFKVARLSPVDEPSLLLQRVGRVLLKPGVDSGFMWAFLHSRRFQAELQRAQKGTNLPHLSRFDVENAAIPDNAIASQRAISQEFELLQRVLVSLEVRRSRLEQLFGVLRLLVKGDGER